MAKKIKFQLGALTVFRIIWLKILSRNIRKNVWMIPGFSKNMKQELQVNKMIISTYILYIMLDYLTYYIILLHSLKRFHAQIYHSLYVLFCFFFTSFCVKTVECENPRRSTISKILKPAHRAPPTTPWWKWQKSGFSLPLFWYMMPK